MSPPIRIQDRPRFGGCTFTTPRVAMMSQLLRPAITCGGLALSGDEFQAINTLYGVVKEKPNKKPPPPEPPNENDFDAPYKFRDALAKHKKALERHAKWEDPRVLMQAGANRNALRHAEADGLRMLAWFARFVPPGEDPVKHLIRAVAGADWDADYEDVTWAEQEDESTEA